MNKDNFRSRPDIGAIVYPILFCIMALCLFIPAFAEQSGAYSYEMSGSLYVKITGYHGAEEEVVIPEYIDGLIVKAIGDDVFRGNRKIKTAVIPHTVASIGERAFEGCSSLETVSLNSNDSTVLLIGEAAFSGCTLLRNAGFDAAYIDIHNEAFYGCGLLEDVRFSDNLEYLAIRDNAFAGCRSLDAIHVPDKDYYVDLSSSSFTGSRVDAEAVFPGIIYSDITQQSASVSAASKEMSIHLSADCKNRNHVGNEWTSEFKINGRTVKSGDIILLHAGDILRIYGSMTEDEKHPDFGEAAETVAVSSRDLTDGFIVKLAVTVCEDYGTYEGNTCTWIMQMKFQ